VVTCQCQRDCGSEARLPIDEWDEKPPFSRPWHNNKGQRTECTMQYHKRLILASICIFGSLVVGYVLLWTRMHSVTPEEMDICEAILRRELSDSGSIPRAQAGVCLRVNGFNPPAALLRRFQEYEPHLLAGSEFRDGWNVLVEVGPTRKTSEFSAEAFASCYVAGDVGGGRTFTLVRKDGKWVIDQVKLQWVS
jgi:hypothetical protein